MTTIGSSEHYTVWIANNSGGFVHMARHNKLTLDRPINGIGNISFVTSQNETWAAFLTSGAENRLVRVTHSDSTDGTDGTLVDDFVIRMVQNDAVDRMQLQVQGSTLEVLLQDLKLPYRITFTNRNAYLIFNDSGTTVADVNGNATGLISLTSAQNLAFGSTAIVVGYNDTTGAAGTAVAQFTVSMESYFSAVQRLCDQQLMYFRAAANGAPDGTGKPSSIKVDLYNRSGGSVPRRGTGTGILTTDPTIAPDNGRILKIPANCTYVSRTQDITRKADKVYVVGGGDGTYQNIGNAGSSSYKQAIYYTPDITDSTALTSLASTIQGIWSTANRGDRIDASMYGQSLYDGTFTANLGDTVAVYDIDGTIYNATFIQYSYVQEQEGHDIWLAYTGDSLDSQVNGAITSALQVIKNTQGAPNVTSPTFSQDSTNSQPVSVQFFIPANVQTIGQMTLNIQANPVRVSKNTTTVTQSYGSTALVWPNGPNGVLGSVVDLNNGDTAIATSNATTNTPVDYVVFQFTITPYNNSTTASTFPSSGYIANHTCNVQLLVDVNGSGSVSYHKETVTAMGLPVQRSITVPIFNSGANSVVSIMTVKNLESSLAWYKIDLNTYLVSTTVGAVTVGSQNSATVAVAIDGVGITGGGALSVNPTNTFSIPIGGSAGQFAATNTGFHTLTITPTTSLPVNLTGQLDIHVNYKK